MIDEIETVVANMKAREVLAQKVGGMTKAEQIALKAEIDGEKSTLETKLQEKISAVTLVDKA